MAPFMPSVPGVRTSRAPSIASNVRRSNDIVSGMVRISWYPLAAATNASAMPVLPLVGSMMTVSFFTMPRFSASSIMEQKISQIGGVGQVIVGGGAAGFAAAEMLRREGFGGSLTLVSADDQAPYDRPNCSKDYLAGNAPEDWMPLKPAEFYTQHSIDLALRAEARAIDPKLKQVVLADGRRITYDKLLLATGAEPVRLQIPGADQPHVHTLRSLSDARAIIAGAKSARRAVAMSLPNRVISPRLGGSPR